MCDDSTEQDIERRRRRFGGGLSTDQADSPHLLASARASAHSHRAA
jgi:hypothetical protein